MKNRFVVGEDMPTLTITHWHTAIFGWPATLVCFVLLLSSIYTNYLCGLGIVQYFTGKQSVDFFGQVLSLLFAGIVFSIIVQTMFRDKSNNYGRDGMAMEDGRPAHEWHRKNNPFFYWLYADYTVSFVTILGSILFNTAGIMFHYHPAPGKWFTHWLVSLLIALVLSLIMDYGGYFGSFRSLNMLRYGNRYAREEQERRVHGVVEERTPVASLPSPTNHKKDELLQKGRKSPIAIITDEIHTIPTNTITSGKGTMPPLPPKRVPVVTPTAKELWDDDEED